MNEMEKYGELKRQIGQIRNEMVTEKRKMEEHEIAVFKEYMALRDKLWLLKGKDARLGFTLDARKYVPYNFSWDNGYRKKLIKIIKNQMKRILLEDVEAARGIEKTVVSWGGKKLLNKLEEAKKEEVKEAERAKKLEQQIKKNEEQRKKLEEKKKMAKKKE